MSAIALCGIVVVIPLWRTILLGMQTYGRGRKGKCQEGCGEICGSHADSYLG